MNKNKRPDWDSYFMSMLEGIASRSTCLRRKVGVIITKDNRIVATGYNGQPPGIKHCTELNFCLREKLNVPSGQRAEICKAVHAEENAILQASDLGKSLRGATLYVMDSPCSYCTKSILSVGIKKVVYSGIYPDKLAEELRKEATWVKWEQYKPPKEEREHSLYPDELIKPIEGFPSYSITNYGRVFRRVKYDQDRKVIKLGVLVKKTFNKSRNTLCVPIIKDNQESEMAVCYLTAFVWVENPYNYSCISWKDNNTSNNHVSNLMWVENSHHDFSNLI